jgi:hypothetical protein
MKFARPAVRYRRPEDNIDLWGKKVETECMQQIKRMQHGESRLSVAAAICFCVGLASAAAHAGTAFGTAALVFSPDYSLARSAPPSKPTLTVRQAAAISMHRLQSLALGSPRQSAMAHESAPRLAPPDPEAKVAFPIQWQKGQIERVARNYKRDGVPLVHLLATGKSLVAIGVSPSGIPGIYFTHSN